MALTKQDEKFYEERLNWRSYGYVALATAIVGAIAWPCALYFLDWSNGQAGSWTFNIIFNDIVFGCMLGVVMSVVLYLFFKFLLAMGWLPSRR
jgi:uncharacterized membrane protein